MFLLKRQFNPNLFSKNTNFTELKFDNDPLVKSK